MYHLTPVANDRQRQRLAAAEAQRSAERALALARAARRAERAERGLAPRRPPARRLRAQLQAQTATDQRDCPPATSTPATTRRSP
jgi:hypothetical protein